MYCTLRLLFLSLSLSSRSSSSSLTSVFLIFFTVGSLKVTDSVCITDIWLVCSDKSESEFNLLSVAIFTKPAGCKEKKSSVLVQSIQATITKDRVRDLTINVSIGMI